MECLQSNNVILTAFEFYEKFQKKNETFDLFAEENKEIPNNTISKKKATPRSVTPIDQAVKKPPVSHDDLTKCFRERICLQEDLKHLSTDDQKQLVDTLTLAIVSAWPEQRRQVPDPFLSELGNKELQRRVAAFVVQSSEQMFYKYVSKAQEMNAKGIFSHNANISRIKTQILHEANQCLNVLKVRHNLADEMRKLSNADWFSPTSCGLSLVSDANQTDIIKEQLHQRNVNGQLHEIKHQIDIISHSIKNSPFKKTDALYSCSEWNDGNGCDQQGTVGKTLENTAVEIEDPVIQDNESNVTNDECFLQERRKGLVRRFDSMPNLSDRSEIGEELHAMKVSMNYRRASINEMDLCQVEKKNMPSTDYTDLFKASAITNEDGMNEEIQESEFSPLLQVNKETRPRTMDASDGNAPYPSTDHDCKICRQHAEDPISNAYEQPETVHVKVAGQNIVRICDIQLSDYHDESKLTLPIYPAVYNEFSGEIDEESVKSLDKHLFAGDEVATVYHEISKTISKDHLKFDKDDYVRACPTEISDMSVLFSSHFLQGKQKNDVINEDLRTNLLPPWNEYSSAREWRNEPKFAGIGREDILRLDTKRLNMGGGRFSALLQNDDAATINKLMKSYASWLTWYKTTLTTEDYHKFLSTKSNDFVSQIYHLYESDDEMDGMAEQSERSSAELERIREREQLKKRLRAEKNQCVKGFWNAQCVLLGGLGNDVTVSDIHAEVVSKNGRERSVDINDNEQVKNNLTFEERMERAWDRLLMPDDLRLGIAVKYSSLDAIDQYEEIADVWENISTLIVEREGIMEKLERFERTASNPNRFFEKGINGSSLSRLNENKTRSSLNKKIQQLDVKILPLLRHIRKRFKDHVTYQGRVYEQKMRSDRVEMLYWLQQERRRQQMVVSKSDVTRVPINRIEMNLTS